MTKGPTAFLVLSFGIAWIWEAVAHLGLGWSLVNPLVQAPAAFAPAVAALVVRRWITREGFADSGSRPRLRAAWRFYLLAGLGPLVIAAVVVGIGAIAGRWEPSGLVTADLVPGLPLWAVPPALGLLAVAGTVLFWGEEFGWTGYLLVRICPGRPRRAAVAAGLIAAIWHFPLAFLGYVEYGHLALGLAGWTLWIVAQEVLLAWLRARSGSVWPACLAHAGNNFVLAPLTAALLTGPSGFSPEAQQFLIFAVLAAVAAGPFLRAGRERIN
ncbi:CPBP family glutamic-type intramembrane protease [Actinoplanes sp. TRM 88003]|uniref:CPBP family glutamic-type intramembrane protease n=1 Tax=Paractinoplanes aksuensis TaxID=2939490 RepID=A0ABT1DT16_9ACTN|nr:CPBP family glutamic-type intramembrane protease [Actinoplanes aksuensis]MCO8273983.1 CPBP family glutamic-type intramembrane protease [Actinoplanes aksuensis]